MTWVYRMQFGKSELSGLLAFGRRKKERREGERERERERERGRERDGGHFSCDSLSIEVEW